MADLRLLLVEDSPADAELVALHLEDAAADAAVTCAATLADAVALVRTTAFDAALVDLTLPDAHGLEAVTGLREAAPDLPLVVLTGLADDVTALEALSSGAQDYLGKDGLTAELLARSLRYARERVQADSRERSALRWAAALLDALESPTCAVDAQGTVLAVNAAARSGGGGLLACAPGVHLPTAWPSSGAHAALAGGLTDVLAGRAPRFDLECGGDDGRWWSVRITPMTATPGAVVTQVDVTALRHAQEQLGVAALHDPLTGLPNRTLLRDRLEQASAHAVREGRRVVVVLLDVDRFKAVNDALGHTAADHVLVQVADRLVAAARSTDTVARISGDVFVVSWVADDLAEAHTTAERLVDAVNRHVVADGRSVQVSVSAGLAAAAPGAAFDDVLRAAEGAMHLAKQRGGGHLEVASAQLRAQLDRRLHVEAELEVAVADHGLEVHYQPVVRLADGAPTGVEALVRLRAADGRLVPPSEFIEVAERSGLIVPMGREVLELACREAAGWTGDAASLTVAVNLSTRQLAQPDVVETVRRSLSHSRLAPSRLVLEVTESSVVEDADAALRALTALKALGVRIAIDDFGTGWSSFLYLKRFPVDVLKIDRSFVAGMLESPDDAAIVASIVRLGQDVGVTLVAEGVESEAQRERLVQLGCTEAQGYLFSRPVPAEELPRALHGTSRPVPAQRAPERTTRAAVPDDVLHRIDALSREGASLHTIAAVLNSQGLRNPDGRRWHARSVARCVSAAQRS